MPAFCQSRKRLQQVIPEPQPSSLGSISQGMPVRRTNTTPRRQARSGIRGRPPFGLDLAGGKRGAITFHKSSEISAATMDFTSVWLKDLQVLLCGDPFSKVILLGRYRLPESSAEMSDEASEGRPTGLVGHYLPNVRNKNVLRSCAKSGRPLKVASPFSYPPTTYFHPNVAPPVNRSR
jgi:hypothetical protein